MIKRFLVVLLYFLGIRILGTEQNTAFSVILQKDTSIQDPVIPNAVLIYHTTNSDNNLRSIKSNGLRSADGIFIGPYTLIGFIKDRCPELFIMDDPGWRNLVDRFYNKSKPAFFDQTSVIYFKPEEPGVKEVASIAIKVNPYKTYVYNLDHRRNAMLQRPEEDKLYRNSRVLLADYLRYLRKAEQMVIDRPDVMVLLDPETAEPFYLEKDDPRTNRVKINGQWVNYKGIGCQQYNAEVIVGTTCIPPRNLIFLNDKITLCPCSMPVINKANYFKR